MKRNYDGTTEASLLGFQILNVIRFGFILLRFDSVLFIGDARRVFHVFCYYVLE